MQPPRPSLTRDEIDRLTDMGGGPCLDLSAWFRSEAEYADIVARLCSHPAAAGPYPSDSDSLSALLASRSDVPPMSLSIETACAIILHATPLLPVPVSCVVIPHPSQHALEVQASLYPPNADAFDAIEEWHGSGSARPFASLFRALASWWACLSDDPHLIGASLGFEDDFVIGPNVLERHPRALFTSVTIAKSLGLGDHPTEVDGLIAIPMNALR